MRQFLRSSIVLATFAVCGLTMRAQAQVSVIAEINRPGKDGNGVTGNGTTYTAAFNGKFVFNTVPSNSYHDLLTGLTATFVSGSVGGGSLSYLTDGPGPRFSAGSNPSDQTNTNFFTNSAYRMVYDLGAGGKMISQINSYSWHRDDGNATTPGTGDRAPQTYTVYGAVDGAAGRSNTTLAGYTLIATVDTTASSAITLAPGSAVLGNSGQHGVSISGINTTYRYILFDITTKAGQSGTFYSELDAVAPASAINVALTAAPGNNGITLKWTTSGAAGETYTISRSLTAGGPYTQIATGVNALTYADTTATTAGTTYYYVVNGVNSTGIGPKSNEASAAPSAPAAPTNLVATATKTINLTWTVSPLAASYNIFRSTTSGGPYTQVNAAPVTTATYTDATPSVSGTTYYYVVAAVNPTGTSGYSNEAAVTPMAPAAPTALTAVGGLGFVNLSWTGNTLAASYNVLRGTVTGGPYTSIATAITTTTYSDTTGINGTPYFYVVVAVNAFGTSGASNEAAATPTAPGTGDGLFGAFYTGDDTNFTPITTTNPFYTEVDKVINFNTGNAGIANNPIAFPSQIPTSGTPANPQHFSARWTGQFQSPTTGPVTFSVNEDDGGRLSINGSQIITDAVKQAPHVSTSAPINMVAGQKYSIVLDYYNDGGGGTEQLFYLYPGQARVIIPQSQLYSTVPVPVAPTNLTAVTPGPGVGLTYTAAYGAISYNIYRSLTTGGPYTQIATNVSTLTYSDNTTTLGTTYYYVVTGVNNSGEGPKSNEASATPTIAAVIGTGDGLFGSYYANVQPSPASGATPTFTETDPTINFADTGNAPAAMFSPSPFPASLSPNGAIGVFSAIWTGYFYSPVTANVTLTLISDDGSRLYFNGGATPVLSSFVPQGPTATSSAPISVVAGMYYPVEIDYFNSGGGATAQFAYSYPGLPLSIVPQSQLYTILPAPPASPTALTATATATGINLAFTGAKGATSYTILRGTAAGGPYTAISTAQTGTTYTDTAVTAGTTYFYVVTATNNYGTSGNSNEASATPAAPAAPTNLAGIGGNNLVTLTWTASPQTTSYNVLRSAVTGGPYTSIATAVTATTYADATVTNGTTYYYVVTATNAFGTSGASNEAAVTPVKPAQVIYYTFENGPSGANPDPITDFSGAGNTGFALGGDEGFTTDAAHGMYAGIVANDPNNQFLSLPSNFDFGNQFTFFCNTKLPTVSGITPIFASHAVFGYGGWLLYVNDNGNTSKDLVFETDSSTQIKATSAPGIFPSGDGKYHAVAAVVNRTAGLVDVYLDGTKVISAGVIGTDFPTKSVQETLGVLPPPTVGGTGEFFRVVGAEFDDVQVFNGLLSASDIAALNVTTATVTGLVALEGVNDLSAISPYAPLGTFHVVFRTAGTTTAVVTADVSLTVTAGSPNGTFSVPGVPAGTYDVLIEGSKNLAVLSPGVVVSGTTGTVPGVLLPAGDANGDNSVDSTDFGLLIGVFNTTGAIAGSGYNPAEDLNFDGSIDSTDFGLLIGEFNNVGAK